MRLPCPGMGRESSDFQLGSYFWPTAGVAQTLSTRSVAKVRAVFFISLEGVILLKCYAVSRMEVPSDAKPVKGQSLVALAWAALAETSPRNRTIGSIGVATGAPNAVSQDLAT